MCYPLKDLRLFRVPSFPSTECRLAAAGSPPTSTCSFSISCPVPLLVCQDLTLQAYGSAIAPLRECHCPFWPVACTAYGCDRQFPGHARSYTSAFPAPHLSHVTITVYFSHVTITVYRLGLQEPFQAMPEFQKGVLPTPPVFFPALLST